MIAHTRAPRRAHGRGLIACVALVVSLAPVAAHAQRCHTMPPDFELAEIDADLGTIGPQLVELTRPSDHTRRVMSGEAVRLLVACVWWWRVPRGPSLLVWSVCEPGDLGLDRCRLAFGALRGTRVRLLGSFPRVDAVPEVRTDADADPGELAFWAPGPRSASTLVARWTRRGLVLTRRRAVE